MKIAAENHTIKSRIIITITLRLLGKVTGYWIFSRIA